MMDWRALSRCGLTSLLIGTLALQTLPAAADEAIEAVPGELLLAIPHLSDDTGLRAAQALGIGNPVAFEPGLGIYRLKLRAGLGLQEAIGILQRLPGVRFVEPNLVMEAAIAPSDPYLGSQYGPQKMQATSAWEIWKPQSPVVIAIADSGIDSSHPDLTRKILRNASGIVGYDAFSQKRSDARDDYYHGTHCAGIAAAETGNGAGIAGVAGWSGTAGYDAAIIRLMPVKVLDSTGYGSAFSIGSGIRWAADNGARVISLSLGSTASSQTMTDAVNYAISKGCVVVAAAGNSGTSSVYYPAGIGGVLPVAATDGSDVLTPFSTYGSWVMTAAPGASIYSTTPTYVTARMSSRGIRTNYDYLSGTSMACPHVAGEAALILSQNPQLSPSQVRSLIASNTDPYTPYLGRTLSAGAGRVNALKALRAAGVGTGSGLPSGPALTSLAVSPSSLLGGNSSTGRVTLSGAAPTDGVVVALTSSNSALAALPPNVTVPAGATSASFTISTSAVSTSAFADIAASLGGTTRSARLSLASDSYTPTALSLSVSRTVGGSSLTGKVSIGSTAPPSDIIVALASSNAAATVPATVIIAAGKTSATFAVTTRTVASSVSVTISASRRGVTKSATLAISPVAISGISFSPSSLTGGTTTTGWVTLTKAAPVGGTVISLSSSRGDLVPVPASVRVLEGGTQVSFTVKTRALSPPPTTAISVTVAAQYDGFTRSTTLSVQ